jgi:hypothetical protein
MTRHQPPNNGFTRNREVYDSRVRVVHTDSVLAFIMSNQTGGSWSFVNATAVLFHIRFEIGRDRSATM